MKSLNNTNYGTAWNYSLWKKKYGILFKQKNLKMQILLGKTKLITPRHWFADRRFWIKARNEIKNNILILECAL